MHNEARKEVEAAQNYGFTSVHFDPEKDQNGKESAPKPSRLHGRQPLVPGNPVQLMIAGTGSTSWRRATPPCSAGAATSSNFI